MATLPEGCVPRKVKVWSIEKVDLIKRYSEAILRGPARKFEGLTYIDLFAGSGFYVDVQTGRVFDGSARTAALIEPPFDKLILVEAKQGTAESLRRAIDDAGATCRTLILQGDANKRCGDVIDSCNKRHLHLCFVDPSGLHCHYQTLACLARALPKIDFVILFPYGYDVRRNWRKLVLGRDERLDNVVGTTMWREKLSLEERITPGEMGVRKVIDFYLERLKTLGFVYGSTDVAFRDPRNNASLYLLVFASRHKLGESIWTSLRRPQRSLFE